MTEITRFGGVKPEGHCRGTPGGQFMAAQLGGCSVCRRANGFFLGVSIPPLGVQRLCRGNRRESCAKSNGRRMQRLRSLSKGTENERSRCTRVGLRRWGNRQLYASAAVAFRGDRDFRRSEGNNWSGCCRRSDLGVRELATTVGGRRSVRAREERWDVRIRSVGRLRRRSSRRASTCR
jgi:hypothetical protein